MALAQKALTIGKALTKPNNIQNGGGLSSLIVRRQVNAAGGFAITGIVGGTMLISEGIKGHNRATLGRVRYDDGLARMTNSFTSGAIPAMKRASGGNYAAFSDMAEEVVTHESIVGGIQNYGATPELISALYRMGG